VDALMEIQWGNRRPGIYSALWQIKTFYQTTKPLYRLRHRWQSPSIHGLGDLGRPDFGRYYPPKGKLWARDPVL